MTYPRREKKHDRLFGHQASAEQLRCDMALAPFDGAVRAADLKWGIDRLPELVSPATAEKWGATLAKLNAAIQSSEPAQVVARVEVALRGLAVMDVEATATGHAKADPTAWEYALDGNKFAIIRDERMWPALKATRPDLVIYTLREVAVALAAHKGSFPIIDEVKSQFPGAQITAIRERTPTESAIGDYIPF